MCGIAGRLNFRSGRPVEPGTIRRMCSLLAHRGPDGEGVYTDGAIGLGHRRLAIIDLSEAGHQPMTDGHGLWITFNGEIYNFLELREQFEKDGYRFRSHSDTEVILAAYRRYGEACLEHLRGMFALAIWDATARTLFIARDRLGKKPLYYRLDDDGIAFASEPKAFLAEASFNPRPNLHAISQYLTYQYVPTPESAFADVERLRPAHALTIDGGGRLRTQRYWKLSYEPKLQVTDDEAAEMVRHELRDATERRMISDVPLGAFLSGGVDSSAVVATMAQVGSGPVKTFSIGFDEKSHDELEYARLVATRYGTDHHEFVVRPTAAEIFSHLAWYYNEPFADSSAIPTYYLSQLTRQHVTVALNGDAGDENFGGYDRYEQGGTLGRYVRLPAPLRRGLAALLRNIPAQPGGSSTWARLKTLVERGSWTRERRYAVSMMQFEPTVSAALCTPEFAAAAGVHDPAALLLDEFSATDAREWLDAMLSVDVERYLPDALLVKVDIASMAHGLEARSPLLDHKFMEFAARLPARLKRNGGVSKYIFKKAMRPLVPAEILDRPKKGFAVPLGPWFRGELRELTEDLLLDARSLQRGYFKPEMIRRLVDEHVRGVRAWNEQIWNLLMLELWHRTFIDARPAVVPATLTVNPPMAVGR